jgi:hypothetical protein
MSLRSQAAADMKGNVNKDGDSVTFTPPGETAFSRICKTARVDMGTDPITGVKFYEPKTHVTVSLLDLLPFVPSPDDALPWQLETTDSQGTTIKGACGFNNLRFDRAIGFVTFIFEDYGAV